MRSIHFLLIAVFLARTAHAGNVDFVVMLGERQLFFDDVDIAEKKNVKRVMHQPVKKGAVIRPAPSLPVSSVQIRMTPIWHPQKNVWQLWDCAASPNDLHAAGQMASGYYESTDGLHWAKPVLGLIEYRGSKQNNYVNHRLGGRAERLDCIIRDETDPDPTRRYKTAVPDVFGHRVGGTAVSPDGIHWTEIRHIGIRAADEWNLTFDAKKHLYLHYLKRRGKYGRAVWLSTSRDFETWTEPKLIFEADDLDQELGVKRIKARLATPSLQQPVYNDPNDYNVDVYTMTPFRYESVYLGMPAMYHATGKNTIRNTDGFHIIELVSSRDLDKWTRQDDRRAFIPPSPIDSGAYDTVQMISPSGAVVRGDELWLYYTGLRSRGPGYKERFGGGRKGLDGLGGAICLAVLRRDGFVSLDASETPGIVRTPPFVPASAHLFVNVNARGGELHVEALDTADKVIDKSTPILDDSRGFKVQWETDGITERRPVSLRFQLRNASLYSYWFES